MATAASPPQDLQSLRYVDGLRSSFQFFLPLSAGGALHLPASAFLTPPREKRLSPDLPLQKQLVCRWSKVRAWGEGRGLPQGLHPKSSQPLLRQ